jgi:hypothetical protein
MDDFTVPQPEYRLRPWFLPGHLEWALVAVCTGVLFALLPFVPTGG